MILIKEGYVGKELEFLCSLLNFPTTDQYSGKVIDVVKDYQSRQGLVPDGVVGDKTWKSLLISRRGGGGKITREDYELFSKYLGCSPFALKSVVKVETGGSSGFLPSGKPKILFEGHVFWKELVKEGNDPKKYLPNNSDIIYRTWDRGKYFGGEKEWVRFNKASKISQSSAIKSTSWGMFQLMGGNYKTCGCSTVSEFYDKINKDEFNQFLLGIDFIKNSGLGIYLKNLDWTGFAKRYNGPGYEKNRYHIKLKSEYDNFKTKNIL